jgi:hypothetical protein
MIQRQLGLIGRDVVHTRIVREPLSTIHAPPHSLGGPHQMEGYVMQHMQITVRYRVEGDHAHFRAEMAKAAPTIASIPGLVRNMWSIDQDSGLGTSVYLFVSEATARDFLAKPTLERLLNGPDASGISLDLALVDEALPEIAGARHALATDRAAAAS